jgi:Uma2 family endonuclease
MSTEILTRAEAIVEMIDRMPSDSVLIQHDVGWNDYEELLEAVGQASGLRISFDDGKLQIMTLSQRHEKYSTLIERMVDRLSSFLRVKVLFYGSATMRKREKQKGVEPDACFYVQNASLVGTKDEIDFNADPPPDVVVEVDLHHDSISKFPIYAALGVREFWRYDGNALTIHHLIEGQYQQSEASQSLPLLTSSILTEFLGRITKEDQYDILLAFEEWLKVQAE